MTNTSGEMNLPSKQDTICHVEKVKPATSAHDVVSVHNTRFDKARKMYFADSKEKVTTRTSTFTFLVCKQSLLIH